MPTAGAAGETPRGDVGTSSDDLAAYLAAIRDIPVLGPEETSELAAGMRAEEARFQEAVFAVPGTAVLLLGRWNERRRGGHVTAALSAGYRDGTGRDWGAVLDAQMLEVEKGLEAREPARVVEALAAANVSLEVLRAIHEELCAARDSEDPAAAKDARRRLGLGNARARAALDRAGAALAALDAHKRRFVYHNLRLVVAVAKRYRNMGVPFLDLIQEGNLGLIRAVEKFDHERGFRFSSYGVWWITQSLIRAIQTQSRTVRVPSHIYELRYRRRRAEQEMRQRLGRIPTVVELAAALEITPEVMEQAAQAMEPVSSIHTPLTGSEDLSLEDRLPDDEAVEPGEALERAAVEREVGRGVESLADRERLILRWRFGLDGEENLTLAQVGERLGLSRERVRQIERRALERLREDGGLQAVAEASGLDVDPDRGDRAA